MTWLAVVVGGACAHTPAGPPPACEAPERLPILIDSAPNLNPGPDGQPLTTVVRVYQLKATNRVETVSLDEILRAERDVLADELLDAYEVVLAPHDRKFPVMQRKPGATHLAVIAYFRQPTATSWRAVAPLPPADPYHCHHPEQRAPWVRFFLQEYRADYVP